MQEDLIGYLLGALEPDEMRRVEKWLRDSEEARAKLAELEHALGFLDDSPTTSESGDSSNSDENEMPPTDLVSRTLAALPPLPQPPPARENSSDAEDFATDHPVAGSLQWQETSSIDLPSVSLSPSTESSDTHRLGLRDWFASVAAACVVFAITIPSLVEGRFLARKQGCQNNLRELGIAMTQFVNRNAEQRLPSIAADGYQAFAGMYAPRLREAGLLPEDEATLCPSLLREQFWPTSQTVVTTQSSGIHPIDQGHPINQPHSINQGPQVDVVTLAVLDEVGRELMAMNRSADHNAELNMRMQLAIERLRWMQTTAGGHYAYTLGVRDGDYFASPRYQGRSAFAVMSDAAIVQNGKRLQNGEAVSPTLISHGGRGINVLYEDGRVGFLSSQSLSRLPDNPLFNHEGRIEAGLTLDDASLAPSWQPPFVRANQR